MPSSPDLLQFIFYNKTYILSSFLKDFLFFQNCTYFLMYLQLDYIGQALDLLVSVS